MVSNDDYLEEMFISQNRENKKLTRTVFRTQYEKKLFLKIFSTIRKKIKRGNQFDVAMKLKNYFKDGKKEGLFEYLYVHDWSINQWTGLYEKNEDLIKKSIEMLDRQEEKRCEFLLKIGFSEYLSKSPYCLEIFENDVFYRYFLTASPEAIVQMKKRLAKK